MVGTKPELAVITRSDQQLVNALADVLIADAFQPPRRLNLRKRHSAQPPEKPRPALRLVQGGRV